MDLLGEFHPASSKGNRYALTAFLHVYRIHILYTTKVQMSRRCNMSQHRPHMLHIRSIKENINGQWNRVQEQALDRDIQEAEN